MINETDLLKEIREELNSLIDRLNLDIDFEIIDVEILETPSIIHPATDKLFVFRINTNNRALLLGQFVWFPKGGMRGFHVEYFYGYLEAFLRIRYPDIENYDFYFDVTENEVQNDDVYRFTKVEEAIQKNTVSLSSPLTDMFEKYNLKYLLMAGGEVSSPTVGMMEAVEEVCKKIKPQSVLDIFSGTGALSKIALVNGVEKVECIDTNPKVIKDNLLEYSDRCRIIEKDAFAFHPSENYDLVILDPYFDYSLKVSKEIAPRFLNKTKVLLLEIGLKFDTYWENKVISELEKTFHHVHRLRKKNHSIAVCSESSVI